jgi:hypothetical protein
MLENQPKKKKELQKILNGFNCHTVRREINEVIKEFRKCSLKEAKDTKTVYPKEVDAVLAKFS